MKVLLLGYSDIARRRVIPALCALGVERVDIASISRDVIDCSASPRSQRFRAYDQALLESSADVVYVSTVNSRHAELAEKALDRGFHVVIDKPACLGLEETRRVVQAAHDRQRCVAKATVYMYHPRFQRVLREFEDIGSQPTRITAFFSFPPRPPENFRYKASLGGGAIWDLGPYAVTPGRVLFGRTASEIVSRSVSTAGDVDTAFSFLATYPDQRFAVGSFGFTTEYSVFSVTWLAAGAWMTMVPEWIPSRYDNEYFPDCHEQALSGFTASWPHGVDAAFDAVAGGYAPRAGSPTAHALGAATLGSPIIW